jgi:all-trans-retinol 13,14-reductase
MADYRLIIIGGGLSGLAAGIRAARFGQKVLILEQHWQPGGLNSYYYRHGHILETGLHAMTNYASPESRHAPLNRLFRQLKLSRRNFVTRQQFGSEIIFPDRSLCFSNDLNMLIQEISETFPASTDDFLRLIEAVRAHDPFAAGPWRSARAFLADILDNRQLEDMLLLPIMVYGNSEEHDMDLSQFVIMFQAVFLEGFFRPAETIKELLVMLVEQFGRYSGEIRYRARVRKLRGDGRRFSGVVLESGEEITCDYLLSTIGIPGTARLADWELDIATYCGRMSFMETINLIPLRNKKKLKDDRTIIFYNNRPEFHYCRPQEAIDPYWGVICFPGNFEGIAESDPFQVRITNAANYDAWRGLAKDEYDSLKLECLERSAEQVCKIVGNYQEEIVYTDSFTPLTIERFTSKMGGAVYGSPVKMKDGCTPYENLFIAGTDQGYLGIVGAMLSGVTIVNQRLLA